MIYLLKSTVNPVILELTGVSSLINPSYLFEFINDMNPNTITYFTGADLSNFKCRYNRFNITVTGSSYTDYTASTISLRSGSYTYNVYEATGSTLNISGTTGIVISTGKALVDGVDTDIPSIYR